MDAKRRQKLLPASRRTIRPSAKEVETLNVEERLYTGYYYNYYEFRAARGVNRINETFLAENRRLTTLFKEDVAAELNLTKEQLDTIYDEAEQRGKSRGMPGIFEELKLLAALLKNS